MSQPIPSLADAIAWAEQLASATAREVFTRVETGRMTKDEGERQKQHVRAIVHHLRQYQHAGPATLAASNAADSTKGTLGILEVQLKCGRAVRSEVFLNAAGAIVRPHVLSVMGETIAGWAVDVIREGTGQT